MIEERRQHARLVPGSPLFVSLDDAKSGLLIDLCEGGVAVASIVPRSLDEVLSLAFDLPEGRGHVEAKAEIAWTRDAGHLTGVRFVDLDDSSRQHLGEWICSRTSEAETRSDEPVFVSRSSFAQADAIAREKRDKGSAEERSWLMPLQLGADGEKRQTQILSDLGLSGGMKSRHTIELMLAVVLLSWALVFLGYQMGSTGFSRMGREVAGAAKGVETPSKAMAASVEALPAANSPATASAALGDSGVVLQVGAMKVEENADVMARDLQKKEFPAFVFRHGGDKLYKVAVGPYSDPNAAVKAKESLEQQGFKPIQRRWLPE
jgi:hypothetical protein